MLFKNLINCLCKDNKTSNKPFSSIISFNFKRNKNDWDNYFFKPLITGSFKIKSVFKDGREEYFTIISEIDKFLSLNVYVFDSNNKSLKNTQITAQIRTSNLESFWLDFERIDSQDLKYRGYGLGRIMMEAMFFTLTEFYKENNLNFLCLRGTVSTNASDTPEKSIKLYSSFDGFKFGEYSIIVDKTTLNQIDRNIYYKMVKETA